MTRDGRFVVLEGGDGSGKTTQAGLLAQRLRAGGRTVVETREPGGTDTGAAIRSLLLDGGDALAPLAEALLLAADRAQHVAEVVRPALARGVDVVCDRYVPSSLVYQGVARELGIGLVEDLSRVATGGLDPTLVVVLDAGDDHARARLGMPSDRLEREPADFHTRVRAAYRQLACERGWVLVDADAGVDEVAARVWSAIEEHLGTDP